MTAKRRSDSIFKMGLLLLAVPLLFELALVGTVWSLFCLTEQKAQQVEASRRLIINLGNLSSSMLDASQVIISTTLTRDTSKLAKYDELEERCKLLLVELAKSDVPPEHRAYLKDIETDCQKIFAVLSRAKQDAINPNVSSFAPLQRMRREVQMDLYPHFKVAVGELSHRERLNEGRHYEVQEQLANSLKATLFAAVVMSIGITAALAWLLQRFVLARFNMLMENSRRLGSKENLLPPMKGEDEFASLDRSLHKASADLEQAAQRERRIISMLGHDMRSPLTAIQTLMALIEKGKFGKLSEDGIERIARAESNIKHLITLITDFVDLDGLSAGAMRADIAECDLEETLQEVVRILSPEAEAKTIEIKEVIEKVIFSTDQKMLSRIVHNLLANAIKFAPEKSTITIEAGREADKVRIAVVDQGEGLPEETTSLFAEFKRQEKHAYVSGSGLGLSIARQLTEVLGGQISAENVSADSNGNGALTTGARFIVLLPVHQTLSL